MKRRRRHLLLRVTPGAVLLASALPGGFCAQGARGQCEVQMVMAPSGYMGQVSVCGDLAVHGDTEGIGGIGAAYVYRRDGAVWVLEAELRAPEPDPDDDFGDAVAVSREIVVVGAEATAAPENYQGAVHVFRYDPAGAQWEHEAMLTASDGDAGDSFGWSLAVDGDVVLIGARDDEVNGESQAGSAYVFRYVGAEWVEEAKLVDPEPEYFDLFGQSVSIDGDVALIGAHSDSSSVGAAFLYRYDGLQWVFEDELNPPDPGLVEWFGLAVALRGNVAVAGAPQAGGQNGAVYVFRREGCEWSFEAKLIAADPVGPAPFLGAAVSVSRDGALVLAGAPCDRAMGFEAGAAHVFRKTGGVWQETAKLTASDGGSNDQFGSFTSLDRDIALLFAIGKAYFFAGFSGTDCNGNGDADSCDIFGGVSEDLNTNGIPDECEAIGDLNGDGVVNVRDLLALLGAWGACDDPCPPACTGDTNGDCIVNWIDLLTLLSNWG
ncbi:MAG: hypothetical protein GF355_02320 [Candidatus Eisenbacteria bacterium]|nr:hypothetical protein [Candidatus Eisenbacteria bacterium]